MKVKNLYALLETVLGSLGLGMIRQQDNLVAVVPMDKALQTQPELVNIENNAVQVGDTVVTRAFNVRYVDIASVTTLLQNMKLSVSATSLEQSNLLLVTCHADRMGRIEQLVEMIDRPGRMKECRLRHLYYVAATPLIAKVRAVLQQLRGIEVATVVTTAQPTRNTCTAAGHVPGQTCRTGVQTHRVPGCRRTGESSDDDRFRRRIGAGRGADRRSGRCPRRCQNSQNVHHQESLRQASLGAAQTTGHSQGLRGQGGRPRTRTPPGMD